MNTEIIKQLAILIAGFTLLVKGADLFVDGASGIAKKFGIPELVIGLTIVAMGTSAPEAAVSIAAASKGSAGISIGNVIGSNIMNIFIILGIVAAIVPLAIEKSTLRYEMPFTILVTVLFVVLGKDGMVTRTDGFILWVGLLIYLAYLLFQTKQKAPDTASAALGTDGSGENGASIPEPADSNGKAQPSVWYLIALTIAGLVVVLVSSDYAVDAAVALAKMFSISDRVIGLTIVALGTSLPELATSVTAALHGNGDMAVGNVIGSCIFNILFVLGTSSVILPIECSQSFLSDAFVAVAATVLLLLFGFTQRKIVRWEGLTLLCCYVAYCYIALI